MDSQRIDELLGKAERLLEEEGQALVSVDATAIERIADLKANLFSDIEKVTMQHTPSPESVERLGELRRSLLKNQLLLVHARDTMRGIMETWTGDTQILPPFGRPATRQSVRLNMKA